MAIWRVSGCVSVPPATRPMSCGSAPADGRTASRWGPHGVLTPEAARRRALAVLAEVWNGGDPIAARDADRAAGSVADLCERFLAEYVEIHCKPGTVREYTRLLRKIVVPRDRQAEGGGYPEKGCSALHFNLRDTRYQAEPDAGSAFEDVQHGRDLGVAC